MLFVKTRFIATLLLAVSCQDIGAKASPPQPQGVRVLYWMSEGVTKFGELEVEAVKAAIKNYTDHDTTVVVVAQSGVAGEIWSYDEKNISLRAFQAATVILYPEYVSGSIYYVYVKAGGSK